MNISNTAIICLSPYQGGMEIDSIKMEKRLRPYCKTILIAKKNYFIANETTKDQSITLETIQFSSNFGFSLMFNLRRIIKKHKIKNILFFGASELKSMYFSFLGLDINLIIRHGTTKSHPKKDWFHRLIYSKVNYHIAICEHLAKNINYIIPFGNKTQLKVIYPSLNFIPKQVSNFEERPHKPIQILHVGRIAEGKGQKAAILACEILYKNNIDFILNLVGGFHPSYQENFLSFLNQLDYKDNIKLIGHTDNVEAYYLNSDIFLFPSDGEGLSNAFIEALVYGLVCLSYDNTSFPELAKIGFQFSLCENQNIDQLQKELLKITQSYPKNIHNPELALSYFEQKKEINQFLKLLI